MIRGVIQGNMMILNSQIIIKIAKKLNYNLIVNGQQSLEHINIKKEIMVEQNFLPKFK